MKPQGGPAGYLYSLHAGLAGLDRNVGFLGAGSADNGFANSARKMLPSRLSDKLRLKKNLGLLDKKASPAVDFSAYETIHFHTAQDLYFNRENLEGYQGKVLLTIHTPCAPYLEIVARLNPKDYQRNKAGIDALVGIENYAFSRADYIVLPCAEAEEPYYHTWPGYQQLHEDNAGKYRYMLTGTERLVPRRTREEVLREYGIPSSATVVSYVGRHNDVKGYDRLKAMGERVLANRDDVWFLCAGKEMPMRCLDHSRWVEAGWTDDPGAIVAASDVFVLPNRETYFDLVLLEVLSLGKNVLLSATGGNRYFKRYGSDGLVFFDDAEDGAESLLGLLGRSKQALGRSAVVNKRIYERDYTVEAFARRYVDLLASL